MERPDASQTERISPSQFMRELRPEYYSDTEDQAAYVLDAPILEYRLDTVTSRNETHGFELFCRKLCERTICPNLRPHTGPDGGGDSKVDTETFPIADDIAVLFYVGEPNAGRERWAFAFSAKKKWSVKVRNDVQGIVETKRPYDRIIFVTSRFARDKDRARIEDELSKKYSIPVTIHDRSWIVKEILENDRKDLAFNYLEIGEAKSDPLRLGPTDYSRTQQLSDIEDSIEDPEAYRGMEQQRVTEALVAAKLSRNLERPRTEIDGRFIRAIRLADQDGTFRQMLEAKYEHIWTSLWWFDDFQFLKNSYEAFETLVLKSDHAIDLEFLCNLLQLFVNSVIYGHLSREECKLDERTKSLKSALEKIAKNGERPNNSLEAETSLLIVQMNRAMMDEKRDALSEIWCEFGVIFDKARGLGEFKADRLVSMVEVAGKIAGNDPAYNSLVDKMAEFVGERKNEAEGALILLKRAQKLDLSENFEIIRLLGKATIRLTKKEYSDSLIEALQLLTVAYKSAGLLWAARASCVFLAATLLIEGEEDSRLSVGFVPTMKTWAWLALELRNLPDFLFAIQLLNGALETLPLTEESKAKVEDDIRNLELALGSKFLNLDVDDLRKLADVPDVLEGLGLFMARSALLYILGHIDTLRTDGSIPASESDEEVDRMFSLLASQPVSQSLVGPITLNAEDSQTLSTTIIGMSVEVNVEGSLQSILIAESVLGSLEAFFATAIERKIIPHTEKVSINVVECAEAIKPSFEMNKMEMIGTLTWPRALSPISFEQQADVHGFWVEVSGGILATACIFDNFDNLLKELFDDEAVLHRMKMVAVASTSYHRVASRNTARMSDWKDVVRDSYEVQPARPALTLIQVDVEEDDGSINKQDRGFNPRKLTDHRALSVKSVIDIHAWDQARWRGAAYLTPPNQPPTIAFLFENEEGARMIFERWRDRFGERDTNEEISLSIIRQLPEQNRHHYCVQVASRLPESGEHKPDQIIVMPNRCMTIEPDNDANLERFLESYSHFEAFYLLPSVLNDSNEPDFLFGLYILKCDLSVKLAADVGEHDIEAMALHAAAKD